MFGRAKQEKPAMPVMSGGGGDGIMSRAALMAMVEDMPFNVMLCDVKTFDIVYMNKATKDTLRTIEHALPVTVNSMVGRSVDIFHKNPSHQRRLLADPRNLPHKARINLAGELLDLHISAIVDNGEYTMAMLTWNLVTKQVAEEERVARLLQMLDDLPVNVMMADPKTAVITYANKTSVTTLKSIQHLLNVRAEDIVGTNMDVFHKNPAHQRSIIANDTRLPWRTKIRLGPETLDLRVTAIKDPSGGYVAPMLTWSVVTSQVKLADDFEANVKGIVDMVSAAATELHSTSGSMAALAEETASQSQTVGAATEELTASVNEIAQQVTKSTNVAQQAVGAAGVTSNQVAELTSAAQRIGKVLTLIKDIASKTDLLALNATIEAARAGESGRGFAVVASEVKALASQTAKATDEIGGQIQSIQEASSETAKAIDGIGETIRNIDEISTTIASAVQEQSAATQEVARNIDGVRQAANETGHASSQLLSASSELSTQAARLTQEVDNFLKAIRAL